MPEEHTEEAEGAAAAPNGEAGAQDGATKKPKAKRNRKPKSAQGEHSADGATEARIDDEGAVDGEKPKRARAPRKPTTLGEPSKVSERIFFTGHSAVLILRLVDSSLRRQPALLG